MTAQELLDACETLSRTAELIHGWHPEHPNAAKGAEAVLIMQLARLYLGDLAQGLAEGKGIDEAVALMISGERELTAAQQAAIASSRQRALS